MNWIDLVQDRGKWGALVHAGMNIRVTLNGGNFSSKGVPVSFSRKAQLHGLSN
jgi:hypothetical protein